MMNGTFLTVVTSIFTIVVFELVAYFAGRGTANAFALGGLYMLAAVLISTWMREDAE